jgi:CheY-like chemotaxis protein
VSIHLADDERATAITLRDDLERVGHKVTLARDGLEARAPPSTPTTS